VVQGTGCPNPGLTVPINFTAGNTVELREDMGGGEVTVGVRYESLYEPTNPIVKDQKGTPITTGTLTVADFVFAYENTGFLRVDVESPYRDTHTLQFEGREFGSPSTILGEPAVQDGLMQVPVCDSMDNINVKVRSNSHLPMTILDIEWKGQFNKFGQRI